MSKRAEALAISIADVFACVGTTFDSKEATLGAAAIIDAELRNERERCSERLLRAFGNLKPSERSSWIDVEATIKLACSNYPEKQDSSE